MKKRFFSIIMVLLLSLVIVACKDTNGDDNGDGNGNGNGDVDTIAPLLEVNPKSVSLEFNQEYDLMTGVTARDNVDGTITDKVVVDDGGFDNKVAGTYTITYTVKDAAGNEATETRTITVAEMRTTIEIDGDQFPINFNPQLGEYNELSFPFDLTKVTVLEAAYVDWLVENNDQRFGAYWSVVATLDADLKVVEYRDYNTNQVSAEGSAIATHWSTGTGTGNNNDYVNRWGMLANLDVPEGGYVVVFINDGANGEGSPRAFGTKHFVEAAFEAIGKQVILHNVPDEAKFDADKTYPVIRLEEEVLDNRLLPVITLEQGIKATDEFGENLLGGVSVTHDRETLTPVVHEIFKIDEEGEETIITAAQIDENDLTSTFGIRYRVEDALGNVGTETRLFKYVKAAEPAPDDKVIIGDREFDLKLNFHFNDQINFEPTVYRLSKEYLETLDGFDTLEDGGAALEPRKWYNIPWGLLAVTDKDGKVLAIRMHNDGRQLTWDEDAGAIKEELQVFPSNAIQRGIMSLVPEDGFIFVFQHTSYENSPRTFGYQTLINTESGTDGGFSKVEYMDVNPFAEDFKIDWSVHGEEPVIPEGPFVTINGEASFEVTEGYDFAANIGTHNKVFVFTYEEWQAISAVVDAEDYTLAGNYKMANIALAVTDENGKVVAIRLYQKWVDDPQSGIQLTVDDEGKIVAETTGAFSRNNMEVGVMDLVPDGGFVYVFSSSTPGVDDGFSDAMKFGYQYLLGLEPSLNNSAYLNGVAFTDWGNPPVNPFSEGFVITVGTEFVEPTPEPTKTYVKIGEMELEVSFNEYEWDASGGIGVITTHAHAFTKEFLGNLPGYQQEIPLHEGRSYIIQYGVVAITDENGKIVQIRIHPGHIITWENDEYVVDTESVGPKTLHHGLYDDIPDGGYVYVFQNTSGEQLIRKFGAKALTGFEDITGYADAETGGVANMTVNPFAEDFVIEMITK